MATRDLSHSSGLARGAALVAGLTALSRLLGFARDLGVAFVLGAGPAADAFLLAFRLPNLFRRFFVEGAVSLALVPALAREEARRGRRAALTLAVAMLPWLFLLLAGMLLLTEFQAPGLVALLAPGFDPHGERFGLAVELLRWCLPYLPLIMLTAWCAALLHHRGRLAAPAMVPALLNLCLLAALGLSLALGLDAARALAAAVLAAGVIQLAALTWAVLADFRRPRADAETAHGEESRATLAARTSTSGSDGQASEPETGMDMDVAGRPLKADVKAPILPLSRRYRELPANPSGGPLLRGLGLLGRLGPAMLTASTPQLLILLASILASKLPAGAISSLYYADRLAQLPLGVFGMALGAAALPAFSRMLAPGDDERLGRALQTALGLTLFCCLPAAAGLFALAAPIVEELFLHGAMNAAAARESAEALAMLALGLPAFALTRPLLALAHARQRTRGALAASLAALLVCGLSGWVSLRVGTWGLAGLALAASLGGWIQALILLVPVLRGPAGSGEPGGSRRPGEPSGPDGPGGSGRARPLLASFLRCLGLALGLGLAVRAAWAWLLPHGIISLLSLATLGGLGFLFAAMALRLPEWRALRAISDHRRL